jgi:hypothetical protein
VVVTETLLGENVENEFSSNHHSFSDDDIFIWIVVVGIKQKNGSPPSPQALVEGLSFTTSCSFDNGTIIYVIDDCFIGLATRRASSS